jgi:hypothetical protein
MDIGLHLTLSDPNSKLDPEVIAIAEAVNPTLSNAYGKVWDLFGQRATPITTDEFRVLARGYTAPSVLIGTSGSGLLWDSTSATTALTINSGQIDRITVGDVLLVDSEIVVVKTIDRGANTIVVYERGAGETVAAAHGTSAVTATIIGNAAVEGHVDVEAMAEQTAIYTNYCQLEEESVDLSFADTEQSRKLGRTEPTLKGEAMTRIMRDLAKTAVYGGASAPTASKPGMTRGLQKWLKLSGGITTAVNGAFTETVLKTMLQTIRVSGGTVNAIVMSVAKKLVFNTFTGVGITTVNLDAGINTAGRIMGFYLADGFGAIPVIVDLDMPDSEVYLVNTNKLSKGWKQNDELRFVNETNTNSRENKQTLQGKFGLALEGLGTDHGALLTLS